jgi:glutamyl/glutaminyl-tRNA synthetase
VANRIVVLELADPGALAGRREWFHRLIDLLKIRSRTIAELVELARPFLVEDIEPDEAAVKKHWARGPDEVASHLRRVRELLARAPTWHEGPLEAELRGLAEELGVGAGKLIHPLRVAVTGTAASAGIFDVLVLLGRDRTLDRLDRALERVARLAMESADRG